MTEARACNVEDVVITGELAARPSRPPDHAGESRALTELAEALAGAPETVLQRLVELALELTRADSAGISLLEPGGEQGVFRWVATAGAWADYRGGTMPREASPCGEVLARDETLLLKQPDRAFPALLQADPPIAEGLLAPFHMDGTPRGTVWVIKHDTDGRFDAEDARLLQSLARFAAVGRAMTAAHAESEERYRELFERIDQGFCIVEMIFDEDGKPVDYRFIEVNPAFEKQTGIVDAEGRRMRDIAPDHEQHWFDRYGAIALTGRPDRFEAPAKALGERWYDLHAFRVGDPAQRRVAILFNDITQRHRDAAALRDSEERLRGVLDGMGEGFGVIGPNFTILEYNREALRMDGRPKAEVVGRSHWDAFPGTEHSEVGLLLKKVMADRQPASLEHLYAWEEGRALWLELRVYPTDDGALAVFWRDVTGRKAAKDLLRESETRFAQFAASTTDVLWIRDAATMALEYISPAFETVFGVTTGAVEGGIEPGAALVDPADRERVMEHLDAAGRGKPQIYEFRIKHGRDGAARWIRDHCFPLINGVGAVERIGGIARDVTGLKLAEEALRESEERQAFLLKLSDALRPLAEPVEIADVACRLLVEHLGGSQGQYATIAGDPGNEMGERRGAYLGAGDPFPHHFPLAPFGEPILATLRADQTLVICDVESDPRLEAVQRAAFQRVKAPAVISVPLVKGGHWRAALTVHNIEPRDWTTREISLVEDVADRTWAAVERARAEAHQGLLLAELQHRVRNTLGVIRSIARRTAQNSEDVDEMAAHLEGRIEAFARVQAMVTRSPEAGVDLAAIVEDELVAHAVRESDRRKVDGPALLLRPKPAEMLSLAVHELATNAVKYGALAGQQGRLSVRWSRAASRLHFAWEESGLDAVPGSPEREGFGIELLTRALPYELSAEVSLEFRPQGICFTLDMPLQP